MSASYQPDKPGGGGEFVERLPRARPHWIVPVLIEVAVLALLRYFVLPGGELGLFLQFLLAGAIAAVWFRQNIDGWLSMSALAALCFVALVPWVLVKLVLLVVLIGGVVWLTLKVNSARRQSPAPVAATVEEPAGPAFPGYGVTPRDDRQPEEGGTADDFGAWFGRQQPPQQ